MASTAVGKRGAATLSFPRKRESIHAVPAPSTSFRTGVSPWLFEKADSIIVSAITKSELYSSLGFYLRGGKITKSDYEQAVQTLEVDFAVLPYDAGIEVKVKKLAEKYAHKTLDNIQLASALTAKSAYFVCFDKRLTKLAELERLKVKKV